MLVDVLLAIFIFIITYFILAFIYRFYIIKKLKNDKNNLPSEILYILNVYKINKDEVDLDKLIKLVILGTTFIFSLSITVALYGDNYGDQLIIGLILMIPLIFICYHIIGCYAKKKLIKNKKKVEE